MLGSLGQQWTVRDGRMYRRRALLPQLAPRRWLVDAHYVALHAQLVVGLQRERRRAKAAVELSASSLSPAAIRSQQSELAAAA